MMHRIAVLSAFIRGQANLTDGHPHTPGPGCVRLNHEEAILVADTLDLMFTRCREWFDAVQDLNPAFLEWADYELAKVLYEACNVRVPSSIEIMLRKP